MSGIELTTYRALIWHYGYLDYFWKIVQDITILSGVNRT